jgi:hypothetical protein
MQALEVLEYGKILWHVYPQYCRPCDFNPKARGRFSAHTAHPARSMFYAGTTEENVLWETLLRDLVPQSDSQPAVVAPSSAGFNLVRVRLTQPVQILRIEDLDTPQNVTAPPGNWRYIDTHSIAAQLLDAAPDGIAGLSWPSRPVGAGRAFVFYAPPLSSQCFEPLESFELDSFRGRDLIDETLARGGLRRAPLTIDPRFGQMNQR